MKNYIGEIVDLTGDSYLNPAGMAYGDGSGTHQRSMSAINSISVHHDASFRPHDYDSAARYRQEAKGHYDRLGPGLQYHYKIDNTGVIFRIRPLTTWLYVVGSAENVSCIAICLDGNFQDNVDGVPTQEPTREQYEALSQLVIELCENHPEFPATYPDVRAHNDYSATACCGNHLIPYVFQISDKASAQNIPSATYDWPEYQSGSAETPPTSTPQPTPQPPTPPSLNIRYRVFGLDGKQSGAYTSDANAWNKYKAEGGSIKDSNGADVTEQLRAKFEPVKLPTPSPAEQDHEAIGQLGQRLTALEAIVKIITDFLSKLFKGWG